MAAFASVWMGLACLIVATTMFLWRPAFTDFWIWFVLWLGAPGTMCIAGLVLWSYRKDDHDEPGILAQRVQCKAAIAMAIVASAIVYALIIGSEKLLDGLL